MLNLLSPLVFAGGALKAAVAAASQGVEGGSFRSILNPAAQKSQESAADGIANSNDTKDAGGQEKLKPILDQLRQQLRAAGIDLSVPISLQAGVTGGIEVHSEHPNWRQIEDAINQVPGLAEQLGQILQEAEEKSGKLSARAQLEFGWEESLLVVDGEVQARSKSNSTSNISSPEA